MPEVSSAYEWRGRAVIDRDGEKVGKIDAIYLDQQTDTPEWALVNTGLFGSKSSFVPLTGAAPHGENVAVTVTKDQVSEAPKVDPGQELTPDEEAELYRHYGVDYADFRAEADPVSAEGDPAAAGLSAGGDETGSESQGRLQRYVVADEEEADDR